MNRFDEMKKEISSKYELLPLKGRILTWFNSYLESENTVTIENEIGTFSQSYITRHWRGKEWLVRFGRIER